MGREGAFQRRPGGLGLESDEPAVILQGKFHLLPRLREATKQRKVKGFNATPPDPNLQDDFTVWDEWDNLTVHTWTGPSV